MPLEGPVPLGGVITDIDEIRLLVEFIGTVSLEECSVAIGTVVFEVEILLVNVTDDETVVEEVVLFVVGIFVLVEDVEEIFKELVEDTVDVVKEILLELLEVVEGATLLLLELLGASLILRAPLIPLFVVRFTSLFFM